MSMKRGIKEFGDAGVDAVHKDMKNIHNTGVPIPVDPRKLYSVSKADALKYLMFLEMKRYGRVKGIGFADGRSQWANTHKD